MAKKYRFMVSPDELHRLGLCGSDALLYSALIALCHRKGKWLLNYTFLAEFACLGAKATAWRSVKKLIDKGLVAVENTDEGAYAVIKKKPFQNETGAFQNETGTPYINTNNIYKELEGGVNSAHARNTTRTTTTSFQNPDSSFQQWWQLYTNGTQWQGLRLQTQKEWDQLTPDQQQQVLRHTQAFAEKNMQKKSPKQPNWYLLDRTWDEPLTNVAPPAFLSGAEQDECRRQHIPLVQIRTPDGLFKIMRKADALAANLPVIRDW